MKRGSSGINVGQTEEAEDCPSEKRANLTQGWSWGYNYREFQK